MTRKAIPEPIRQAVLLEAGYRCANPVCRNILTIELHHLEWVKDGGDNAAENLLAVCAHCHELHTKGFIPASAMLAWKSLLVSLSNPHRSSLDLLLVLSAEEARVAATEDPAQAAAKFRFSGDSLPAIASLLTGGLLEVSKRFTGFSYWGGSNPSFEVTLTEKGRLLIAGWKAGSPESIRAALEGAQTANDKVT